MAVRLDLDALRDSVDPVVHRRAEELLAGGRLGEITTAGGGASAAVDDGPEVWAGMVAGVFVAECGCAGNGSTMNVEEFCPHAVALVIAAVEEEFAWSSAASRPLPPPTGAELTEVRRIVDNLASEATTGRWGLRDITDAGEWILEALEPIVERRAIEETLDLVEHAVRLWDGLAVHLYDAWEVRGTDPSEIGDEFRAVHVRVCADLDLGRDELVGRLAAIIGKAEAESCLDRTEDYLALLGHETVTMMNRHGW